jgi:drug/metabolite transporter (DMT)-like permease
LQLLLSLFFLWKNRHDRVPICGTTRYIQGILFLRSVIGYGGIAFGFLAIELIPVGDATVLVMLAPMITSFLAIFILGEPWKLPEILATCVSLIGATLVARPSFIFGGLSTSNPLGVVFALISSVASGAAYICVRLLGTTAKMPWYHVVFAQALGQIFLSIPSAYLSGQTIQFNLSTYEFLSIFIGGCIGAFSQMFMTLGMQKEKSARSTVMRMSDVIFGFVWQAIFTSDPTSGLSILGALLVTSSILIIVVCKDNGSGRSDATVRATVDNGDSSPSSLDRAPPTQQPWYVALFERLTKESRGRYKPIEREDSSNNNGKNKIEEEHAMKSMEIL